jgi:L-rhamnose mutarotase
MERLCFMFTIFEGTEEAYEKSHQEIWPELSAAILDAGYRNYSLFRRGTEIICYGECVPDIETVTQRMKDRYATLVDRWNKEMDQFIVKMTDEKGALFVYDLIWHLDADLSSE